MVIHTEVVLPEKNQRTICSTQGNILQYRDNNTDPKTAGKTLIVVEFMALMPWINLAWPPRDKEGRRSYWVVEARVVWPRII